MIREAYGSHFSMHCRPLMHRTLLYSNGRFLFWHFLSPSSFLALLVVIRIWLTVKHKQQQQGKLMHYLHHHRWQLGKTFCVLSCARKLWRRKRIELFLQSVQWSDSGPTFAHFFSFTVICTYSIQINSANRRCQMHNTILVDTAGTFSIYKLQFEATQPNLSNAFVLYLFLLHSSL